MNPPRRRPPAKQPSPVGRWLPAIAAVGVLAVVVLAGAFDGGKDARLSGADGSGLDATPGVTTSSVAVAATDDGSGYGVTGLTVPPSTLPDPNASAAVAPVNKTMLARTLRQGTFGDDVKMLQARLTALGFVPGVIDGAFGEQTLEAVWAYEKLILQTPYDKATGKVTDAMWQGMQDPVVVQPRRPASGTHVEVYLPQQVAAVFTDNAPILVLHISSGTARTPERTKENSWCETIRLDTDENGSPLDPPQEKAVCGVSYTPGGVFRFQRQVQGDRVGALGRMFNPVYFNYGIAIHGAKNVPLTPASHGCIRMNQTISNTFQTYIHLRDRVYVWGWDGKEPEQYTKRESTPIFNYPEPDATTTTVKSTTTTTAKPAVTATTKPTTTTTTTTTTKPAATTTTSPATTTPPPSTQATSPPTTVSSG